MITPTILKYRRKLAALVVERMIAPKRDRAEIQEEIDFLHRQIRGRQIRLLKAPHAAVAPQTTKGEIPAGVIEMLFGDFVTINPAQ